MNWYYSDNEKSNIPKRSVHPPHTHRIDFVLSLVSAIQWKPPCLGRHDSHKRGALCSYGGLKYIQELSVHTLHKSNQSPERKFDSTQQQVPVQSSLSTGVSLQRDSCILPGIQLSSFPNDSCFVCLHMFIWRINGCQCPNLCMYLYFIVCFYMHLCKLIIINFVPYSSAILSKTYQCIEILLKKNGPRYNFVVFCDLCLIWKILSYGPANVRYLR